MSFLQRLLPREGFYCVATPVPGGTGFRHHWCQTIDEVTATVQRLDAAGQTVYLAQASFRTAENRKRENAAFVRNFFLDIDCGPEKEYPSQADALKALKAVLDATRLPAPSIVVSGNGLYAHWLLVEDVDASGWKTFAGLFKQTLVAYGFKADPSRTADTASVLRPIGSTHRKDPANPKSVRLLVENPPVTFDEFVQVLTAAARRKQLDLKPVQPPKENPDLNAEFYSQPDSRPSYALQIASRCRQIGHIKNALGAVTEPLWYGMLGLVSYCSEGATLYQLWSSGHPEYSPEATEEKVRQWQRSTTGAVTCAYFGQHNPVGCVGCAHKDKIKSPFVLGFPDPEPVITPDPADEPPKGFRRAKDGLWVEGEGGQWECFYDQDLRPVRIAFDESLGFETTTVRHTLPHEGELEFTFRSSVIHDAKQFLTTLTDNHVKVLGAKEKKVMVAYFESYTQKLQRQRKMSALYCQMGWKDRQGKAAFVLGAKVFHPGEEPDIANLARNVPNAAAGFRTAGSLDAWVSKTALLDQSGMEPFAFTLLAGGFGAPLMKFTGYDGALLSLVGDSGTGKTLMLRMVQSVWGYHNDLMMLRDDTRNALVSRLGVYGNLPLTIDEVTNIDGLELSDLVYRITQGRDKARLTKAAEERKVLNTWNTLAVVTTNASLAEKLSGAKHDAGPELNRVFEYYVPPHPTFQGNVTTDLYWTIDGNYGHAGEVYAQWLVDNRDRIKGGLDLIRQKIDALAEVRNEERFWSAVASTAIYGGLVAQRLGLIRFDVSRLIPWAADCIRGMRGEKTELVGDSYAILGQFLDEHAHQRLIVKHTAERSVIVIDPPRGPLVWRHEQDTCRVFISRAVFKTWLSRKYGSYNKMKNELLADRTLRNANARKTLGQGTIYGGAQQPCWEIDLKSHKLGHLGIQLVTEAEMLARAPKEVVK